MNINYEIINNDKYGFKQVYPTPSIEIIENFYSKEFYSQSYAACNDSSCESINKDKEFYDNHYIDIISGIQDVMGGDVRGKKILDIGCGWCHALELWNSLGLQCYGFDPSNEAVARGEQLGLTVKRAGMSNMHVFSSKFDIVTMLNVLEHLPDPELAIRDIRKNVISKNGVLVIDVPNDYNFLQTSSQKIHNLTEWWVAPPAHLNYFDKISLQKLLEYNGFKVRIFEASFPMEMFLLMGFNYVTNSELGRECHERRMLFEKSIRNTKGNLALRNLYRSFAEAGIGRQILAFAEAI